MSRQRWSALLCALALLAAPPARAQDDEPARSISRAGFDSLAATDFTTRRLDPERLRLLAVDELAWLRGIVFGRHGRVFRNDHIQPWLETQAWYHPDPAFRNSMLNDMERQNLDLIRAEEARQHDFIEPGDLRWWQDRRMTVDALGRHSSAEWLVLRAEVEAIHGRTFPGEPWLQHYFDERYWYRADSSYDARVLTAIERENLALIDSLGRPRDDGSIEPCDMGLYEERLLTTHELRGSSFMTLRILRNEVYARHGMPFPGWLGDYFAIRTWYVRRDSVPVELSPIEKRNVATIAAYEATLRDSLRSRPLDPGWIQDMFLEDARRLRLAIYARHGRVFRRKWEQDYAASLPGYRADPDYTDDRLNEFERANIAALVEYEKTAASVMDAVEG